MNHTAGFNSIPTFNHFLGLITPWKHLLNNASPSCECLLTMWPMKELNLAQMTFPFPLNVVVALQYKWFSHDLIHSAIDSHPFSLESFERTFLISENKGDWILQLVNNNADQNNCHFYLMIISCIPIWLLLHYQWWLSCLQLRQKPNNRSNWVRNTMCFGSVRRFVPFAETL